jgi:predicted nicotinamide N-methyase
MINCKVLELGCGCCALPGQVAASLGAMVTVTDLQDEIHSVLANINKNSKFHARPMSVCELDWDRARREHSLPASLLSVDYDLVLCADLVYELTLTPLMYTLFLLIYNNPQISILMSNTNRKHVHLFRRRMTQFCNFETLSDQESQGNLIWLIRLNDQVDWNAIWSIFDIDLQLEEK